VDKLGEENMNKPSRWGRLLASAVLPMSAMAGNALAQTSDQGLGEVIVTATRTGQTQAQKTPLAITVLSQDQLSASGVANVKDLVGLAPNISVSAITVSPLIYIRGIGSNNVNNGSDPNVTVQVDGVYVARPFGQLTDYLDVARIEVLRGPQGTLYGRNAVGGTLNVISRMPGEDHRTALNLTAGAFNLFQAQGVMSGPIAAKAQGSIAFNYLRHDGYVDNVTPGKSDLNDANRGGVRLQLRLTPTDRIEAVTRADWSTADEHFDNYTHLLAPLSFAPIASSLTGDYTHAALSTEHQNQTDIWGISEDINFKITDDISLRSISALRRSHFSSTFDTDGTEVDVNIGEQADTSRQYSQELALTTNFDHFDGVLGVYYFNERQNSFVHARVPPSVATAAAQSADATAFPVANTESFAGFAQGTYRPIQKIGLTAGVRYTEDEKALDTIVRRTSLNPATPGASLAGFPFAASTRQKFNALTPKFGLDWQATPNAMLYASATRGFKSGGTNYAATNAAFLNYKPETIWSYESGLKSDWFGRRLRVNITAFKYNYKDLQVLQPLAPGIVAINNAATATVTGFEIETMAKPRPELTLTANYSSLDATYDTFTASAVPAGLVSYLTGNARYNAVARTYNASGNEMNLAPKSTFSASAQYDFKVSSGALYVRGDYYWQDRTSYDPSNVGIMFEPAYDLVNLALGFNAANDKWGAQILAKNIADNNYLVGRSGAGSAPAGLAGVPRTITAQLSLKW
jgi:iron complex outermembrane receptor protein